jgi:hypothetical protein
VWVGCCRVLTVGNSPYTVHISPICTTNQYAAVNTYLHQPKFSLTISPEKGGSEANVSGMFSGKWFHSCSNPFYFRPITCACIIRDHCFLPYSSLHINQIHLSLLRVQCRAPDSIFFSWRRKHYVDHNNRRVVYET